MRSVIFWLVLAAMLPAVASAQTGKHVAVGGGLSVHKFTGGDFSQRNPGFSFTYRITLKPGTKQGWSWEPKGALGWFSAKTDMAVGGIETRIGAFRSKPVMAGVERSYRQGLLKVGLSLVAGPGFNRFTVDDAARVAYHDRLGRDLASIRPKTSLVVRPELSGWYDVNERFGVHVAFNYQVNRPTVETTAGGVTTSTKWKTDHANAHIGLVVGLF